ncbi:hypothetical protein Tco_1068983 [Tanacetum coccineum]|uniref:Uncharacterized protein n=1 Tax=Tanacetum coccineum TaxID=301880 RepID=A0ABQ5HIN2_9ASTR
MSTTNSNMYPGQYPRVLSHPLRQISTSSFCYRTPDGLKSTFDLLVFHQFRNPHQPIIKTISIEEITTIQTEETISTSSTDFSIDALNQPPSPLFLWAFFFLKQVMLDRCPMKAIFTLRGGKEAIHIHPDQTQKYTHRLQPYDGQTKSTSSIWLVKSILYSQEVLGFFKRDRELAIPLHIMSLWFLLLLQISLLSGLDFLLFEEAYSFLLYKRYPTSSELIQLIRILRETS